jgi:hypothetical protein
MDKDNNSARRVMVNDVVLTTYNTIQKTCPELDRDTLQNLREKAATEDRSLAEVIQDWVAENKKASGILQKIHWYRVSSLSLSPELADIQTCKIILDEAVSHIESGVTNVGSFLLTISALHQKLFSQDIYGSSCA